MKNKVVLITGANGGLGSSITRSFLAAGAAVTGVSNKISAEDFTQPNFVAASADLTKASAAADVVQSVVKREGRLDILIHVLGAFAGGKSVVETDDATWQQMQDLNLSSAFYVLRAAIPHLRKSGEGRVVVIGSLAAVEPNAGLAAYVTFKSALVSLVRTVALENRAQFVPNSNSMGMPVTTPSVKLMPKIFPQNRAASS